MFLKTVQECIFKKEQHFMQIRKNFLDLKIQLNLDDLVIIYIYLPEKETLKQRVAKHDIDLHVS